MTSLTLEQSSELAALWRIAWILRTNWGDDALQSIGKVLDDALPGWLERAPPAENEGSDHG